MQGALFFSFVVAQADDTARLRLGGSNLDANQATQSLAHAGKQPSQSVYEHAYSLWTYM